jgi:hypothetical protein
MPVSPSVLSRKSANIFLLWFEELAWF